MRIQWYLVRGGNKVRHVCHCDYYYCCYNYNCYFYWD